MLALIDAPATASTVDKCRKSTTLIRMPNSRLILATARIASREWPPRARSIVHAWFDHAEQVGSTRLRLQRKPDGHRVDEHLHREIGRTLSHHADEVAATDAHCLQAGGQIVRSRVEFGVGDGALPIDDREATTIVAATRGNATEKMSLPVPQNSVP